MQNIFLKSNSQDTNVPQKSNQNESITKESQIDWWPSTRSCLSNSKRGWKNCKIDFRLKLYLPGNIFNAIRVRAAHERMKNEDNQDYSYLYIKSIIWNIIFLIAGHLKWGEAEIERNWILLSSSLNYTENLFLVCRNCEIRLKVCHSWGWKMKNFKCFLNLRQANCKIFW